MSSDLFTLELTSWSDNVENLTVSQGGSPRGQRVPLQLCARLLIG